MGKRRTTKQSSCQRCGPITSLLRLVVRDDGFPATEPYPGKPRCKPLDLFYCPQCLIWVATTEKDARRVLMRLIRPKAPNKEKEVKTNS